MRNGLPSINSRTQGTKKSKEFIGLSKIKEIMCFFLLFTAITSTKAYGIILPDVLDKHQVIMALSPQEDYDGSRLFEYINGGADVYFNYGFKTCFVRKYGIKNSPGSEFKVNVYDLGKPIHAFGIFREFFGTDSIKNDIGAENVSGNGYCYFWKHRFYVEVDDISTTKPKEEGCREIAQKVANTFSETNDMPAELEWLPKHDKIKRSEKYSKKNFLSRSFLNNVIYANYLLENTSCILFILSSNSENETQVIFNKLGNIYQSKNILNRDFKLASLPYFFSEELLAVRNANKIMGVIGKCSLESKSALILRCIQVPDLNSISTSQ